MSEFSMKIVKEIGVITETDKTKLMLAITDVNGTEKYDLRTYFKKGDNPDWQVGRGVRLSEDELFKLGEIINTVE